MYPHTVSIVASLFGVIVRHEAGNKRAMIWLEALKYELRK